MEEILKNDGKGDDTHGRSIQEKIAERFLESRQVYLWGAVEDKSSARIVERMLYLESDNPGAPIYFFINSPGGIITSGMAIFDVMHMISSPVYTITMGMAASMGAILFCAGEKGHRYIFEHARVMIHQPLISGQIIAPALDIKIHADEIKKTRNELNRILATASGKTMEQIEKDTDRDYYLNADESVKYGIADKVLKNLDQLPQFRNFAAGGKKNGGDDAPKKSSKPKK